MGPTINIMGFAALRHLLEQPFMDPLSLMDPLSILEQSESFAYVDSLAYLDAQVKANSAMSS